MFLQYAVQEFLFIKKNSNKVSSSSKYIYCKK